MTDKWKVEAVPHLPAVETEHHGAAADAHIAVSDVAEMEGYVANKSIVSHLDAMDASIQETHKTIDKAPRKSQDY